MTQRRVVVGYDGSASAEHALDWAADRAIQHHLALELVHAVTVWPYDARTAPTSPDVAAHDIVDAAVQRLLAQDSRLDVTTCVDSASPAALLLGRAADADCIVVGARGHGGFAGLHLGGVPAHLTAHAPCPVVVVRGSIGIGTVVGVDASPSSDAAIAFAFDHAATHGDDLTAVHAWLPFYAGLGELPYFVEAQPADQEEDALLSERLAGWREKYPEVPVRTVVCGVHPVAALLEEAAHAGLLVVGSHGRGGFPAMLLGSVSRSVLHHAACTVAVVRQGSA